MPQAATLLQLASGSATHHFCIWRIVKLVLLLPLLDSLHKSVFYSIIELANCLYMSASEVLSVSGARETLHCPVRAQTSSLLSRYPAPG